MKILKIKYLMIIFIGLTFTQCFSSRSENIPYLITGNVKDDGAIIQTLNGSYIVEVGQKQITGTSEKISTLIIFTSGDSLGYKEVLNFITSKISGESKSRITHSKEVQIAAAKAMEPVGADGILITSVSQKLSGFWPISYKKTVYVTGKPLFIKGNNDTADKSDNSDENKIRISNQIRIFNNEIAVLKKAINQLSGDPCCQAK